MHPGRGEPVARPCRSPAPAPPPTPDAATTAAFDAARASPAATLALGRAHAGRAGQADAARRRQGPRTPTPSARPSSSRTPRRWCGTPRRSSSRSTRDGLVLQLRAQRAVDGAPTDAGGVLVIEEALGATTARQAFELANVAVGQATAPHEAARSTQCCRPRCSPCIGGVILNLMPCVFPVLSIKVLSLVEQAGQSRSAGAPARASPTPPACSRRSRRWAPCCWRVRAAGAEVGWGFQLQSPVAVALLAYVLFAMGLEPLGRLPLWARRCRAWAHGLTRRSGLAGSFFTGVLAAVVATPCTAPFMGTARRLRADAAGGGRARRVPRARARPGAAVPGADVGAAADRPPAAARRLDGDAQAGAGLPGLCHGGLAGVGAGPAGRALPACSPP